MSDRSTSITQPAPEGLKADSLLAGVSLLLALTVVQRLVGFARNLLFCRWLSPEELGRWNLAFSFLMLAAPLIVLGLPGCLGRYVEHFRKRGQLQSLLRWTTVATVALTAVGVLILCLACRPASWLLFGDPSQTAIMLTVAIGLVAVIGFHFLVELFTALRQVRVVSCMQLANSLLFATFAVLLMWFYQFNAVAVVVAYALACLVSSAGVIPALRDCAVRLAPDDRSVPAARLWGKLLPFAAWLWCNDLLSNLFGASDRYMIVHFAPTDPSSATQLVGQYHSSLVVPQLLIAVATLLASVILPYLSHDWELEKREAVSARLNLSLKLYGLMATAGGVAVLVTAPWLFHWALAGKYQVGESILPWSLVLCVWCGLSTVLRCYLLCVERAGLASVAPMVGLMLNILLNLLLLPVLGLLGAVLATAAANAAMLALLVCLSVRSGMLLDRGTLLIYLLPATLALPVPLAAVIWAAVAWLSWRSELMFSSSTLDEFSRVIRPYRAKVTPWTVRTPVRESP